LDTAPGKIHRIKDDGSIPPNNPMVDQSGALASIWSYGHRNPQGMAFQPGTNLLWAHEHGPRGGDELNLIQPGKNYGWPITSYGTHYDGRSFTDKTTQEGIEAPITYWVPSIAPCGMTFISGERYPGWKGDLMIGSLRFKYLNRCKMQDNQVVEQEQLLENIGRMRCLTMSPDGYLYLSVEEPGFIFRIVPQ
jgi:glucose/arabinose dehydrogenase